MQSYINSHKEQFIEGYYPHSYSRVAPGDIIKIDYMKSEHNKHPHVLVLNKGHKGLMHGLVIDYMSKRELKYIKDWIGKEYGDVYDEKTNTPGAFKKMILELGDPISFYETRLKSFMKTKIISSPYRTYKIDEIRNIKKVKFDWSKV